VASIPTSRRWLRALVILVVLGAVVLAGLLALAWRPEIDAIPSPSRASFEPQLIERGSRLASAGNCIACHSVQGGMPFAGGLPLPTPFGTLYSTNITPDAETGIGGWSQEAFNRSMRQGVDRRGSHLYPAFPYTHFTRVTDDDLRALYAYVMTRTPVRAPAPANELTFPLGFRPLLAGWKMLFFEPGVYRPDPARDAEWNRGAYLAQGLTHCSACHSPRNAFGAERKNDPLGGGLIEGWWAPALNAKSHSPVPWSVDQLTAYLRTGIAENHAIAGGPMQDVVRSLAQLPQEDVRAIAVYVASTLGPATAEQQARAKESLARAAQPPTQPWSVPPQKDSAPEDVMRLGATVYAHSCAGCHGEGRQLSSGSGLQLPLAIALYEPTPINLIRIVRQGITPREGEVGRWMPDFAGTLTDEQLTALAIYLRSAAANAPPWSDVAAEVKKARHP
jgi:mono/diheme cytochrome c family protein